MNLANIKLEQIDLGDRCRQEIGDIKDLAEDMQTNGLICPIAIVGTEPPYRLVAGGRRFAAALYLKWSQISCNIYDHDLTELEFRSIELSENIKRKDLTWSEEVNSKREIHRLQVEIHGEKTTMSAVGHSMRDTAKLLNKDHRGLARDIKLAEAVEKFPEIGWDKCKTKQDALKIIDRMEDQMVKMEIARRAQAELGDKTVRKVIDSFIVMDFFDHVEKLPDNTFDLVEIDTPYAINLPGIKLEDSGGKFHIRYGNTYNEIPQEFFLPFISGVLKDLYRIMSENSWLIWWFGPEPWFDSVYHAIIEAGFKTRRMPGIWTKPTGQTNTPNVYLASSYEMFFYARKGEAVITKKGRSNNFDFSPVSPAKKIHPTERPIELLEEILKTFVWEGARIYVPFCGSGNTLRAAFNLGMHPIGCELEKSYKDSYAVRILGRNSK